MNLKRILSFFKSKLFFVGLMIIAQLLVLVVLIALLSYQFYWFYLFSVLLSFIASVYIVNREDNPSFKILWVLLIMTVLVGGASAGNEAESTDDRCIAQDAATGV